MNLPLFSRPCLAPIVFTLIIATVRAHPTGGTVAAGQAGISSSGATTTVSQSSNRAIVNWGSFSTATGESVVFNLPSANSAVLNRVTGSQLSSLMGNLSSNGQVYLLNPNGIVIGPNGKVKTAGFVASTLGLGDQQFMQGGAQTFQGASTAGVVVLGTVKALSGDVLLVAAQVDNQGKLIAPDGHVILSAGSEVLYSPGSDSHIVIAAPTPATGAAVNNGGIIKAAAVQLAAAGSPYALAVNNGGQISAIAVNEVDGHIVLDGGAGDVVTSGSLAASTGANGGAIAVTGGRVAVNAGATLSANGTGSGDGGAIHIQGATATAFAGAVSATGGPQGGKGGQAEVSGGALSFTGSVDLSAAKGQNGALVLDPDQITVVAGNTPPPQNASSGTWSFTDDPGAQTISNGAIANLLSTGSVTLQATSSITVGAGISSPTANILEFDSPTINVNASISLPSGVLAFDGTTSGPVQQGGPPPLTIGQSLNSAAAATLNATRISVDGYSQVALSGPVQTPLLQIDQQGLSATSVAAPNAGNQISTMIVGPDGSGGLDAYSGTFAVSSSGNLTVEGKATVAGGMSVTSTGNLALSSADVTQGTQFTSPGSITIGSSSGVFENNVGASVFSGAGRRIVYSSTSSGGYTQGGLGYTSFSPVAFGQDPDSSVTDVVYLATAVSLPILTIAANSFSRNYGQPDPAFTASYTGGSTADLSTAVQFSIAGGTDVYPGSYTIIPFGAASATHQLDYVDGTLTVNKAPLLISANGASRLYGSANPAFSASFTGLVNGDTSGAVLGLTYTTSATTASNAGSYAIMPSGASALYYNIGYAPGSLTITPAPLLITPNASRIYGGALSSTLPTSDFSGFVNGDTPAVLTAQPILATSAITTSGVGLYSLTASGAAASNYAIAYAPGALSVTPDPLLVTASEATRLYGAANPSFAYSVSGLVNGDPASVVSHVGLATTATGASSVGSYPIIASGGSAANYALTYASGSLSITPAPLLITANASRAYGSPLPSQLPLSDFTGLLNGDSQASLAVQPTLATAAGASSGVGSYSLTASGATAANYTISFAPGTLSVTPALLLITADNQNRLYGSANPSLTESFSGLVNGDSPAVVAGLTVKTTATAASNAGTYPLVPSGGSAANYTLTYASGTLSVTPAPLLIVPSGSTTYGSIPNLEAVTYNTSGLVNGDTLASFTAQPSATTDATKTSGVALYSLLASGAVDPNYSIRYQPGVMTVNPAVLTLAPSPLSAVYGSAGPSAASATYAAVGLVNGDTLGQVFSSAPSVFVPSVAGLSVGTYATSVLFGKVLDNNYLVTTMPGTVTITPAPLTITPNLVMNQGAAFPAVLPPSDFSGFVNGDSSASLTKQPSLAFGDPLGGSLNASGAVDPNYTFTYKTGSVETVIGTDLTVSTTTITPPASTPATITVDPNYTAPRIYGSVLGGLGAEADTIIQLFLQNSTSTPPQTEADIIAMLNDPASSAKMLGLLQPLIYQDLSTILNADPSTWTSAQSFFVQQMQTYVQTQRQSAALQGEADYETWANAQVAQENAEINAVSGPAQVYLMAALSSSPPVPPPTFLNEVQAGITMNTNQAATAYAIDASTQAAGAAVNSAGMAVTVGTTSYQFINEGKGAGNALWKALDTTVFAKNAATMAKWQELADGGDALAQGIIKAAATGSKVASAVSAAVGSIGVVAELVGAVVQIGTGSAAYAQEASYNTAFQQAAQAASQPVTVADLKSMLSGSGSQLTSYLSAYLATGPAGINQTFNPNAPTQSLTGVLSIISHL